MRIKIGVLNYGLGNVGSIINVINHINHDPVMISKPDQGRNVDYLIIPGVGAFDSGISLLRRGGFDDLILSHIEKGRFTLGICLGAQMLCSSSEEGAELGLNVFSSYNVIKFQTKSPIPHMGWNYVWNKNELISDKSPYFYFVHSYHFKSNENNYDILMCNYDYNFPALIGTDNTFAAQFHPEKSLKHGINFINAFVNGKIK